MDLRQIKNIIKEFEESKINKLEISDSEFSIKLEKNQNQTVVTGVPMQQPVMQVPVVTQEMAPEPEVKNDYFQIKAPLVGTFYESPSPDASSFVEVNQKVNKGDTLFIVEAMKVMNEITAPVSGTIMSIHVSDATMVEFGQVIMEIKE